MKIYIKISGTICFYIISTVLFLLIHELSHGICAILFGNKFYGIYFDNPSEDNNFLMGGIICKIDIINPQSKIFINIAGSIGTSLVSLIIFFILKQLKRHHSISGSICLFWIFNETLYWGISPILQEGDAYNFATSLKINYILISSISLILSVIVLGIYIYIIIKYFSKKTGVDLFD